MVVTFCILGVCRFHPWDPVSSGRLAYCQVVYDLVLRFDGTVGIQDTGDPAFLTFLDADRMEIFGSAFFVGTEPLGNCWYIGNYNHGKFRDIL